MSLYLLWGGFISSFILFLGGCAASFALIRGQGRNLGQISDEERRIEALRRRNEQEERRRLKKIKAIAKEVRKDVIAGLGRAGISRIYERKGAVASASLPVIRECLYSKDALYFRINRLPFGHAFTELLDRDVERNLSLAVGRECRIYHATDIGVWVMVGLKSGLAAIPKFFPWYTEETKQNAAELLPATRPWAVPIGMTENRQFVYEDLRDLPHLLVAGATDGGKSVFLNQLLCSLIKRNGPEQLQLLLIDLKGGLEFTTYFDLPHLLQDPVVERGAVAATLERIIEIKNQRFEKLRKGGYRKIQAWNANRRDKMPYIVVVFDEIANLMRSELKQATERLLAEVAEQGRAAGIHLILCTQVTESGVINLSIRGNITSRVVFATDETGSKVALGNGAASRLKSRRGRAIYRRGVDQVEVQAPFISDEQIAATVAAASGKLEETDEGPAYTAETLFKRSLDEYGGRFTIRVIYDEFGGQVPETFVRETANRFDFNYETGEPVISIEGERYILAQIKMRGGRGRWLIPVNGHVPTTVDELDEMSAEMDLS